MVSFAIQFTSIDADQLSHPECPNAARGRHFSLEFVAIYFQTQLVAVRS